MTFMEAFKQFKIENPNVKIGKSKFASLRPKHVQPVTDKDHNVCCCLYHENFEMLLDGVRKVQTTLPKCEILLRNAVCSWSLKCCLGACESCQNDADIREKLLLKDSEETDEISCPYVQWNNENKKVQLQGTFTRAKHEVMKQMTFMRHHSFVAKTQLNQIRYLKENLSAKEAVLQEDFSENFILKHQDEIMTAHWISDSVTFFTAVITTSTRSASYVVISDEMHHDKFAVVAFNRAILQAASSKGIACHKLHILSDGAGGQFKNRFTLSNIIRPEVIGQAVKEVDWNFFATAHGKGPVDGVGGTVKRAVWMRILQKRVLLNNPKEFYDVVREACPNVNVLFVGTEDVAVIRKALDNIWTKENPQNIPQIRSLHYFRYASPTELESAVVRPFLPGIQREMNKVVLFQSNQVPQHVLHSKVKIVADNYYAVDYVDRYYIGRVLHAGEKHGYWKMKFRHQMSQDGMITFTWPRQDDCDDVHDSLIFFGPIVLDGCGQLTIPNLRDIHECFANIVEK